MTIDRRSALELGLIGAAAGSFPLAVANIAAVQPSSKTYVLVHGAGRCMKFRDTPRLSKVRESGDRSFRDDGRSD